MKASLPPQPSPFDADFVDAACSRYEMPPIAREQLGISVPCADVEIGLPSGGLGFDLGDDGWKPARGAGDWARRFARRPWVDVGLPFGKAAEDGLNCFGCMLDIYMTGGMDEWTPNERQPELGVPAGWDLVDYCRMPRPEHAWLMPMLEMVWLPATDTPWVSADHLSALLAWLLDCQMDPRELVSPLLLRAWLKHPRPAPQPYRRPRGSGDVTRADVNHFFEQEFRELGVAMCTLLGWDYDDMTATAPAKQANALARRVLGIPVDLRAGFLVDAHEANLATADTYGVRHVGDETLGSRLRQHFECNVRRVRVPTSMAKFRSLEGAAWSCDVSRLVSAPEVWGIAPPLRPARRSRTETMVQDGGERTPF